MRTDHLAVFAALPDLTMYHPDHDHDVLIPEMITGSIRHNRPYMLVDSRIDILLVERLPDLASLQALSLSLPQVLKSVE